MANPKLIVEIAGDSRKLTRTLKQTETSTQRWAKKIEGAQSGSRLGGIGGSAAALRGGGLALGAGVAVSQAKQLAEAASGLNEQLSKSSVIFGRSADGIEAWSKTLAKAFGISQTEGVQAAATFGSLFTNTGTAQKDAASLSKTLVELAGDLASFNDTTTVDALEALRSGLSGEIEPLRRFQVFLTEAAVAQRALTETGKKSVRQLTQGEKIHARYSLILEQTSNAQGDAERTSSSLANQQRILAAQVANAQVSLGKVLLPTLTNVVSGLNDGIEAASLLGGALIDLGNVEVPPIRIPLVFDIPGGGSLFEGLGAFHENTGPGAPKKFLKFIVREAGEAGSAAAKAFNRAFANPFIQLPTARPDEGDRNRPRPKPDPTLEVKPPPRENKLTASQRNTFFDAGLARRLDRVQDIATINGQISALTTIGGLIEKRIAATKDITRKLSLEDQLVAVNRQKKGLAEQLVADAQQRKQEQAALAAEKKAREQQAAVTKLAQRTSRQFRLLGLNAEGETPTPGVENLKKRVAGISERIGGTKFDTPKLESQLARFRKVLSEGLVPKDVRAKIDAMLRDINDAIKGNTGAIAKTTHLNADKILEGLGLSPDESRNLKARLTQFNASGVGLAGARKGTVGAFGVAAGSGAQTINLVVDGQKMATVTTRHQQRHRQANPTQKRGGSR